ncbi:MAG: hypothetical protein ACUVWA_00455 [Candidatus Oleimicrobiaceae bacterium]
MNEVKLNKCIVQDLAPQFRRFLEADGSRGRGERHKNHNSCAQWFSERGTDNVDEGALRKLIHLL